MARVFISHASEDRELADEVNGWLTRDGHEVFLDYHPDEGIAVGDAWEQRLYERLRWADAVVCLVTSAYLASTWCAAEVGVARSQGSRLLPLLAEQGVEYPLLEWSQYADLASDPAAARAALTAALRRVDAGGGRGWPDNRNPFPGLQSFEVDQHRVFFGRTAEVEALAGLLRSPAERTSHQLLLVVGPSGCGKSSLVRAGLLPAMAEEPGWWTLPPFLPGADPVAALGREVAAAARQVGLDWTVGQVRERLEGRLGELADELLLAAPRPGHRRHLLVVVDQFEELLTQATPTARAGFAELLRPALGTSLQVVATLRPGFLTQLLGSPELADLPTRVFTLRPLRRDRLATVIRGPARLAGIGVDEELVERLVGDTDSGQALPLLAFTLEQLADGVGRGGQLSAARYEQLGGVRGALIRQADAALADACAASGRNADEVIGGLLRLVTVDEEGRPTRWRVDRDELPEPVGGELDAFVARRLLATDAEDGRVVVGVTHEAFLSAWPPLANAITAAASALRMRRAVEQAAAEWDEKGRPTSHLWERGQLAAAVNDTGARIRPSSRPGGQSRTTISSPGQRPTGWLRGSRLLVADKVELGARARDFLHTSIRVDRRRRRRATTILSVLLVLAVSAAGVAVIQQRAAQRQQRIATARGLVAQADATRARDPRIALLLGIAAHHIHPDGETQASLVNTLTTTHYGTTLPGPDSAQVVESALTPDGRTLAASTDDRKVVLWDVSDPAQPRRLGQPLTGHSNDVWSLAFAPDGRTLATTTDHDVLLWDITDRTRPHPLGREFVIPSGYVSEVAFSPDGRTLATVADQSPGQTLVLWDVSDRAHPRRLGRALIASNSRVSGLLAFAPDGRTLATSSDDRAVALWDVADPARPRRLGQLTDHSRVLWSAAFSPDGRTLATAADHSTGTSVVLWDVSDRAHPRRLGPPLPGLGGAVFALGFAPGGRTLVTSRGDQSVVLWDVSDRAHPRRLGPPLPGLGGIANDFTFTPDGRTLAVGWESPARLLLWDLSKQVHPHRLGQPFSGHTKAVASLAFSPDGRTLATGSIDRNVVLWDVADPGRPHRLGQPLTGHGSTVASLAFTPDGRTLATGSAAHTVAWDLSDPAHPRRAEVEDTSSSPSFSDQSFSDPNIPEASLAFAPDGRILAVAGDPQMVNLWDLSDLAHPHFVRFLAPPNSSTLDPSRAVVSLAFTPDGRTLAAGNTDHTVALWDVADPTRPRRLGQPLTGHGEAVVSVAFAPDGRTLATGSPDHTVILWDLSDRTLPRRLGTGNSSPVRSLAFAPDGRTLATGSDQTVVLWDLTDRGHPRRIGQPLTGHGGTVASVAFTPDGRTLATGSSDHRVTLWDLSELDTLRRNPAERACSLTGRGLDRDEWARYVPGLPYKSTCPS